VALNFYIREAQKKRRRENYFYILPNAQVTAFMVSSPNN
jgi:hypothetical protein